MSFLKRKSVLTILTSLILIAAIVLAVLYPYMTKEEGEDFSALTYVALGDSITYGLDEMRESGRVDFPYPTIVKDLLGIGTVHNYGISGSTLTTIDNGTHSPMAVRYKEMTDNADIVSVMGGVNDYLKAPLGTPDSTDTGTVYGALNVLCAGLKAKYPEAYIFFMTPYKFSMDPGANPEYGHTMLDIANAIKEVCAKHGFDVLDMHTYGMFELEMYTKGSDGLHPTQEFFDTYTAPMIARFIKENYRKPSV